MCGIVGAVAARDVLAILLEGLKRLEYRGYDSAGIAVITPDKALTRTRTLGKIANLRAHLDAHPLTGQIGIAHTRWATHGVPNEQNAHPHISHDEVAIVHNGIIENFETLKESLHQDGYQFQSETDTEVIAHLLHRELKKNSDMKIALRAMVNHLHGAYSLAILHKNHPRTLYAVRSGSPLVIGLGMDENFLASDPIALLFVAQRFIYLEEGDIAIVEQRDVVIYDKNNKLTERPARTSELSGDSADKGHFRHFMQKEIYDQTQMVRDVLEGRISQQHLLIETLGARIKNILPQIKRIQIVACGTSYHAGLVARYWFEALAGVPCSVEIASEFRYRRFIVEPNTLFVAISQSGETADTLAALRLAHSLSYSARIAICNVQESTLMREADATIMMRAGVEIGVASTKAFTAQLLALLFLVIGIGRQQLLSKGQEEDLMTGLQNLPAAIGHVLQQEDQVKTLAKALAAYQHALFIGRGNLYPIALEGALKLKEISYIHAEAYPAGELKHGALALVDSNMPIIAIAAHVDMWDKMKANLSEIRARGGEVFLFAIEGVTVPTDLAQHVFRFKDIDPMLAPLLAVIPLQLLAYHVAVFKGTDVDQPRNLAKSVTVE